MSKISNSHNQLWDSKKFLDYMLRTDYRMREHVQKATGLRPSETISGSIAWMASWIYLRWLEHEDAEREAIALFNGEDYNPIIPQWLKWQAIRQIEPDFFSDFLDNKVVPYIQRLDDRPLAIHLKRMAANIGFAGIYDEGFSENFRNLIDSWDFSKPEDVKSASNFLDSLIFESIQKVKSFEIITPQPIVDLMVQLANPQPGESVYDPCFGCGGLLVQSARKIREAALNSGAGEWERLRSQSIYGIEWNETAYAIAVTRIVLAGIPEPGLELTNALLRPRGDSSFDVVLADLPWGHITNDIRNDLRLSFNIAARDWSNLFVQHVMQVLKPGGRAIVTLPEGILFAAGPDQQLRKWLLSDFRVDGVISLPEGSFAPYTGIKSNLVLFRRDKPVESVYFYQVQKLAGTAAKLAAKEETTFDVVERFRNREIGPYSWNTTVAELAKRNWDLVAKKPGDEQLKKWLSQICTIDSGVENFSLQQVAVVSTGIKYDRRIATEQQTADDDIRLFRISDIRESSLGRPSLFVKKTDLDSINNELIIRPNDILFSKTGTIGKMAIAQADVASAQTTATQSLVIIRPNEQILPEYLFSILNSVSYKQILEGHTRGGTNIRHITTEALRHLQIPVPDLLLQDRVVKELKQRKDADPLAVLADIVLDKNSKKSTDVSGEIDLATIIARLPLVVNATDTLERVKQAAGAYSILSAMYVDNDYISYQSKLTIADAVEPLLLNIDKYPKGIALFSVLWHTLTSISYLDEHIEFSKPLHAKEEDSYLAEKLISLLSSELNNAIDELKNSVVIDAIIKDNLGAVGTEKQIDIFIKNSGYLPLIDCSIEIEPHLLKQNIEYFAEQSGQVISVTIPKQLKPGKFDFSLNWNAKHIDGSETTGTIDLAVEIQSIRDVAHLSDLGASPYVTGSPIEADRPEMFFGRQDIVETIKRQLPISHRANIILLEGNRRSGKTSILKHLSRPDLLHGWIPVYCNFQGGTGDAFRAGLPTHEIFKLLTKSIFDAVLKSGERTWFPDLEMPDKTGFPFKTEFVKLTNQIFCDDNSFEKFDLYLQSVLRIIAPKRLLLMLDEFDKIQEGIDTGVTSPQVPENLRYILHTYPDTSAILSYSKILRKLRNEYWSMLFGLGHRVTVGALEEDAAKLLVTQPALGKLVYSDQARDKIINLCAQQPFIIQQLCNCIFDKAAESGQRTVTENMVDEAAQHLSDENEHFRTLWDHHIGSERRRFILVLCHHLMKGPDPITFSLLEMKLLESGIYAKNISQVLKEDLDHLKALDLITMQDKGRYFLTIPLMASWIQKNVDFEGQKRLAQNESQENLQ